MVNILLSSSRFIQELLLDFPGVFWFDSSIRFHSNNLTSVFAQVVASGGAVLLNDAGHNTFTVTHPQMFEYLPSTPERLQETPQKEANCMLFLRTRHVYDDVIKWWVLCALNRGCIAPTYELACDFNGIDTFAKCHRFDQSAVNVLLANAHSFNVSRFSLAGDQIQTVKRYQSGQHTPSTC